MSLDHAILGFLQYKPLSGYDLKTAFDLSVQHFWPADQSQIYRTLGRLAEDGLVTVSVVEQEDRPDRKVYQITDAGREELSRWLAMPLPFKNSRNAHMVQVFFSAQLPNETILALLRRSAEHCRAYLVRLGEIPEQGRANAETVATPRDGFFWLLTLECGVTMMRAHLAWLESVIDRLEREDYTLHLDTEEPCAQ